LTGICAPPTLARRILTRALPPDAREHVVDDLDETYRRISAQHGAAKARRWYWRQAFSFSRGFLVERLRDRIIGPHVREIHHNRRGRMRSVIENWTSDVIQAVRRLRRAPVFTVVTIATLALAIGTNTAVFSVVDAVLIDPLPYPNSDRLVSIRGSAPASDLPRIFATGPEFYVGYRDDADLLEDIGMYQRTQTTVRTPEQTDRLFMLACTTSFLTTLGARTILGRLPSKQDDDERANVVVISHALWTTWFGSDPTVIGRSLEVSGTRRTIIGVMSPEARFPDSRISLWLRTSIADEKRIQPGRTGFELIARMKPDITPTDLTTQLLTIVKRFPERFGGDATYARHIDQHRPVVRSLEEDLVGSVAQPLWILLGTAGVVFLIACANVANLFIARAENRRTDLAVRSALGAGRAGLIRSQMAEALLLAVAGGMGGVFLARLAVPVLVAIAPTGTPNIDLVELNPLVLLFTTALSMLAAGAFGLLPAVQFSRPMALGDLRHTGRVGSRQGSLARNALVVVQTASALVLLVAAGLLARSFTELSRVNLGFDTENIFTFQVAPQRRELIDGPTFAQFHQGLMERFAAMPDVESVGLINELPLDEGAGLGRFAAERTHGAGGTPPLLPFSQAGGDYFKTLKIPLVSGRLFDRSNHALDVSSVIVSRAAAQLLWPNEDPIGKRVLVGTEPDKDPRLTVVGVVGDVRLRGFRQPSADPMIYLPMVGPTPTAWAVGSPAYVVRSKRAAAMAADIRAIIREYAPEAPMYRVFTMAQLADRTLAQLTFMTIMLGTASGLALLLGAVGLYGVLSYVVSQRSREIAVRMALGAESSRVRRMVVMQGARVASIGVALGIAAAAAVSGVLKSQLFGVSAFDTVTFAVMTGLILAVALLASYIPARSASLLDPMQALRRD
jgi:predicted permease